MDEKQKEGILAFIRLYPLVPEQMAAAVEQISAVILFEACVIGAERPEKQLIFKLHRNFRAALFNTGKMC